MTFVRTLFGPRMARPRRRAPQVPARSLSKEASEMRPAQRSRSRSRSSQRSGETLSSGDARRFRECQAWARSLPYTTRNDMIEDGSVEESPGEAGDTQPQASQVPTEVEVVTQACGADTPTHPGPLCCLEHPRTPWARDKGCVSSNPPWPPSWGGGKLLRG